MRGDFTRRIWGGDRVYYSEERGGGGVAGVGRGTVARTELGREEGTSDIRVAETTTA